MDTVRFLRDLDLTAHFDRLQRRYGNIIDYNAAYLVFGVEEAEAIFRAGPRIHKGPFLGPLRELLGDGLITSDGDRWERDRHALNPLFDAAHMSSHLAAMQVESRALRDRWRSLPGTRIDVRKELQSFAFEVTSRAMLGAARTSVQLADLQEPFQEFQKAAQAYLVSYSLRALQVGFAEAVRELRHIRLVGPLLAWTVGLLDPLWLIPRRRLRELRADSASQRSAAAREQMRGAVRRLVEAVRADGADGADAGIVDFLLGLEAEDGQPLLDVEGIVDHVLTFLLAGYDTSAGALSWTLYLLAKHPQHWDRIAAEAEAALDPGADWTLDQLRRLTFTEAVFDEALRLYPLVSHQGRTTVGEEVLAGYRFRAATPIVISAWVIHRRDDYWERPEHFDPERFLGVNTGSCAAYMPFGGGARSCLGSRFAQLEAKVLLASLVLAGLRPELADPAQVYQPVPRFMNLECSPRLVMTLPRARPALAV